MDIGQVKETLRSGIVSLDTATTTVNHIRTDLAECDALIKATTQGCAHQRIAQARATLGEAYAETEYLLRLLARGTEHAVRYANSI